MSDDYFCNSRPVPDQVEVEESWIPTALYKEVVALYEAKHHNNNENDNTDIPSSDFFLESTVCPSHVRNLQPLAKAPSLRFSTDRMMPGFCLASGGQGVGEYWISRVQLKNCKNEWCNFALVVNNGDADCNSGHWGGAFSIMNVRNIGSSSTLFLSPMAWIRSVGDSITYVEQAKATKNLSKLPDEELQLLQSFNNDAMLKATENLEIDSSIFIDSEVDEEEQFPDGIFGGSLRPGICETVLEKLVGAAFGQMMVQPWSGKEVNIP